MRWQLYFRGLLLVYFEAIQACAIENGINPEIVPKKKEKSCSVSGSGLFMTNQLPAC